MLLFVYSVSQVDGKVKVPSANIEESDKKYCIKI